MFTAQAAIFAYGHLDYLAPGRMYTLHECRVLRVGNKNQGMQVAVARVKDISHAQVIAFTNLVDLYQRLCQATAWDGDVYGIVRGR